MNLSDLDRQTQIDIFSNDRFAGAIIIFSF